MPTRTNTAKWMENQKRWQINVQKDGVRRSFTSSTPGRKGQREANAKADAWLESGIINDSIFIDDLYKEFLENIQKVSIQEYRGSYSRGKNYILPVIGRKRIRNLTEQDLQSVIDKAYHEKQLSKKTLSNIRYTLLRFVKYCRMKKLTALRPEEIAIPKNARTREKSILQPDALHTLFHSDKTFLNGKEQRDMFINAYRFAVLTGLRPGEMLGLKWSDIEGNTVYVRRAINTHGETTKGKNENAIRSFPLNQLTQAVLEDQKTNYYGGEFVFNLVSQSTYGKRWARYCEYNHIPHISLYEMRHTFVSIAKVLPEGLLKSVVGHSRSMDTYGIYSHNMAGDSAEISALLEHKFQEILSGK